MIQLELSEDQAQSLFELLDVSVKTGGLQAAKHAVPITDALMKAVEQSKSAPKKRKPRRTSAK